MLFNHICAQDMISFGLCQVSALPISGIPPFDAPSRFVVRCSILWGGELKVKICGITSLADAMAAIEYGADALGFIFAKTSARFIQKEGIKKIIASLPPFVTTVGVFTEGTKDQLEEATLECGIDLIQLHGRFPREIAEYFSERAIQVILVRNENDLLEYQMLPARAYLLDSFEGGSGIPFNWEGVRLLRIAREAKKMGRVILAGGLTPENVREAIDIVSPYAVDVCSGVEIEKGKKDHEKMRRFILTAKKQVTSS